MKQFKAIVIGLAMCLVLGAGVEAFASSQGMVKRQKKEAPAPKKEEKKPTPVKPKPKPKPAPKSEPKAPKNTPQAIESRMFTVKGVSFKMMWVQGGTFMMGATPEQQEPFDNEKPVHQVTLSSYWIGETEVTQALWQAVMGSNPSYPTGSNLPVTQVSWNDCQEFVRKLNALTGQHFRLPTEAEWEFAARGGCNSRGYQYSGSNNLGDVAWYADNSGGKTHPVATKAANELGIYDMSGNVWEWCQDWYGSYSSGAQTNPTGPTSGSSRVNRGGSWYSGGDVYSGATLCRSAARDLGFSLDYRLGVRLAL